MKKVGYLVILLSGVLWGTMGFFVRHLIALGLDQIQIIFMKMLIGMICISAFLLVKDRSLLKIRLKDWWIFAGCGIVSMLGSNFCYYKAMEYTTLAVAVVILYIAPAVAMLVSALIFKEKVTPAKL
ncbi:MAG: DMT family transporter, partial [Firmicutes bacterium]|nr:DMT family transporter [Bacillota bacterium]